MKKTFFLALASCAMAIGLTCCSGGSGDNEVSPAAKYLKGETIEASVGSRMAFRFADEFWGETGNTLPCTLQTDGVSKSALVTVLEYTMAPGSDAEGDEPDFQTMKLRIQYDDGTVGSTDSHQTFWGFPPGCTNVSLGGKGVLMNLTVGAHKRKGSCELVVQAGASFTTVQEGDGNKKDYTVAEDNVASPVKEDTATITLGGTGEFTFID